MPRPSKAHQLSVKPAPNPTAAGAALPVTASGTAIRKQLGPNLPSHIPAIPGNKHLLFLALVAGFLDLLVLDVFLHPGVVHLLFLAGILVLRGRLVFIIIFLFLVFCVLLSLGLLSNKIVKTSVI